MRGQAAWAYLKKSAADQRQAWREVGEALSVGRALHPSNQAFGKWVKEHGFDDIDSTTRSNAMWLAQNWASCSDFKTESHPNNIRQAHRDSLKDTPPSPDLSLQAPTRLTASIEQVAPQAKTINKLASMAERGTGQEKGIPHKFQPSSCGTFPRSTQSLQAPI